MSQNQLFVKKKGSYLFKVKSLSIFELNIIRQNANAKTLGWPGSSLPPAVAMGLPKLIEKRILRLVKLPKEEKPGLYTWTIFGRTIADILKKNQQKDV